MSIELGLTNGLVLGIEHLSGGKELTEETGINYLIVVHLLLFRITFVKFVN